MPNVRVGSVFPLLTMVLDGFGMCRRCVLALVSSLGGKKSIANVVSLAINLLSFLPYHSSLLIISRSGSRRDRRRFVYRDIRYHHVCLRRFVSDKMRNIPPCSRTVSSSVDCYDNRLHPFPETGGRTVCILPKEKPAENVSYNPGQ